MGCDVKSAEVCATDDWLISRGVIPATKQHFNMAADQAQSFYLSSDNLPELEPSLTANNGGDSEFFNDIDGRCTLSIYTC